MKKNGGGIVEESNKGTYKHSTKGTYKHSTGASSVSYRHNFLVSLITVLFCRSELHNTVLLARAVTPHSAGDSGVEEQDDAMVPAETLCELLRRAFRLTTEKFTQYEDIVATQLEKKSPQKVCKI